MLTRRNDPVKSRLGEEGEEEGGITERMGKKEREICVCVVLMPWSSQYYKFGA